MKLLDVTTGQILHRLMLQDRPRGVCRMSGDRVAVTLPLSGRIQRILELEVEIIGYFSNENHILLHAHKLCIN